MKTTSLRWILKYFFKTSGKWCCFLIFILGLLSSSSSARNKYSLNSFVKVKSSGKEVTNKQQISEEEEPESKPSISQEDETGKEVEGEEILRISHEVLDDLLRRYVDKNGRVKFQFWKRDRSDVELLVAYVKDLSEINPNLLVRGSEIKAAWINLFNAIVLMEILKHYPIHNVLKIPQFYDHRQYIIGEQTYSLLDIEKQIFPKRVKDPRAVFARVFGARGGPTLPPYAYDGEKIEEQLDAAVLRFLKDPQNALWDAKKGRLMLSGFFQWYEKEIGSIVAFIRYYQGDLPQDVKIEFGQFDWRLNDAD